MRSTQWLVVFSLLCFLRQGHACPTTDLDLEFADTPYSGSNGMRYLEGSNEIVFKDKDGSSQAISFKDGKWCLRNIGAPGAIQDKAGAGKPPACFGPQEFSHTDNASKKEISKMTLAQDRMHIRFGRNKDSITIVPKGDGFQVVLTKSKCDNPKFSGCGPTTTSRLDLKKRVQGSKGLDSAAKNSGSKKIVVGQKPGEAITSKGCGVIEHQAASQPEYIDPEGEGPYFEHALGAGKGSGKAGR